MDYLPHCRRAAASSLQVYQLPPSSDRVHNKNSSLCMWQKFDVTKIAAGTSDNWWSSSRQLLLSLSVEFWWTPKQKQELDDIHIAATIWYQIVINDNLGKVLYLYWRTLLTNATFPEIIIDTRRVSLRGEDGVPWRDRWAFHLNSKTFLITNVVDSLKESCVSINCSTKLNNWPDDLSVMLEPPTGRMVEPEEEVIALKWNNFFT